MGFMTGHEVELARDRKARDDYDAAYVAAIRRHGRAVGHPYLLTRLRVNRYLRRAGYLTPK